ncbi:hypothetical protein [Neobacillus sp. Marseille-QA0830]
MHQDYHASYKELEAEINKKIHELTNCRTFTAAFGKAMEQHLIQLEVYKRMTTKWLNQMDLPNKDELAEISHRMVRVVEQTDTLDEVVYWTNLEHHRAVSQLKMVRQSWQELRSVLKEEVQELKKNNIHSLQAELNDLKRLFQIEDKGE